MPGVMVTSGGRDSSLDGKGKPKVVVVKASGRLVSRVWHLLSQARESWPEGHFSPQHAAH